MKLVTFMLWLDWLAVCTPRLIVPLALSDSAIRLADSCGGNLMVEHTQCADEPITSASSA